MTEADARRQRMVEEIDRSRARTEAACACLNEQAAQAFRLIDASQCRSGACEVGPDSEISSMRRCQGATGHAGRCVYGTASGVEWAKINLPFVAQYLQHAADEIARVRAERFDWVVKSREIERQHERAKMDEYAADRVAELAAMAARRKR